MTTDVCCPHGYATTCFIVSGLAYYEHTQGEPCELLNSFVEDAVTMVVAAVHGCGFANTAATRVAVLTSKRAREAFYAQFEQLCDERLVSALCNYCTILYEVNEQAYVEELIYEFGQVAVTNLLLASGHDFSWVLANDAIAFHPARCMQDLAQANCAVVGAARGIQRLRERSRRDEAGYEGN